MSGIKQSVYEICAPMIGRLLVHKNKYCNVIYYHDIVQGGGYSYMQINIEKFKRQMLFIKKAGFETIRFDDFNNPDNLDFKKKRVLIAFDDGWLSNYEFIYDFMMSYGLKYNVFLTIGEINKNPKYMTWNMVRQMHESGLVGLGIHTFSHPDMSNLETVDLHVEINKANEVFFHELGYEPDDFCYPFGFYSEASNKYLSSHAVYKRIYTSAAIFSYTMNNSIVFGRNGISDDDSFYVFNSKLRGFYNNVYETIKKG